MRHASNTSVVGALSVAPIGVAEVDESDVDAGVGDGEGLGAGIRAHCRTGKGAADRRRLTSLDTLPNGLILL